MSTEAQLAKIKRYLGKVQREQMSEEMFVEEVDLLIRRVYNIIVSTHTQ